MVADGQVVLEPEGRQNDAVLHRERQTQLIHFPLKTKHRTVQVGECGEESIEKPNWVQRVSSFFSIFTLSLRFF